jgi:hypothetical protein
MADKRDQLVREICQLQEGLNVRHVEGVLESAKSHLIHYSYAKLPLDEQPNFRRQHLFVAFRPKSF